MGKQIYPRLFNGSRYAERLPIGREDVLRSAQRQGIEEVLIKPVGGH